MPARLCWQDPDNSYLLWGYTSALQIHKRMLTVIFWMEHRAPNVGAKESTQGAEGVCNPIIGTTIWTNQYPGALVSSCICIIRWPSRPSLEREAHWTLKLHIPQYRGMSGPKKWEWVGREVRGRVWGTFGIALEMSLRKIRNKKQQQQKKWPLVDETYSSGLWHIPEYTAAQIGLGGF